MRWQTISLWKGLSVLLLLAVGVTTCACGAGTPDASPIPISPSPTVTVPFELPVTIALAGRFEAEVLSSLDEFIVDFEAANPDIRVEIVEAPPAPERRREAFIAELQSEDADVDIYVVDDTWLAEFAESGWLVPLTDPIESMGMDGDAFLPASLLANTFAGHTWALPWTADGGVLYFRQDLLDEHGHNPPGDWPTVQRLALELKTSEGMPSGYVWQGAAYETLTCNILEFVWAYGGDVLDAQGKPIFDSPETRAGLRQMEALLTTGASPREVADYGETQSLEAFQSGDAALMRNWAFAWSTMHAEGSEAAGIVGAGPLPASCLFGQSLALSSQSIHPDQAFRFMAFLTAYDQQVHLAQQAGQPPVLQAAYLDPGLLAAEPFFADLFAALSVARPRPRTAVYPLVSEAIYTEVHKMLTGGQDAGQAAANVQRRLEEIVEPK